MSKVYKGDIGTKFIISAGEDLTDVIDHKLKILKPDKSIVEWITSIEGNPVDGKISYIAIEGDLDQKGLYKGNAFIDFGDSKFTGETFQFIVFEMFE